MGKKRKFTDDQLLSAVVKYSEITRGKIKATELAEWARENIQELKEVRDYHFTRPVRVKDSKTGKVREAKRSCTVRIEEINNSRSITIRIRTNTLLHSSNPYEFLELSKTAQMNLISETRLTFQELEEANRKAAQEIKDLRFELSEKTKKIEQLQSLESKLNEVNHIQSQLRKQLAFYQRTFDEQTGIKLYEKRGYTYNKLDLQKMEEAEKLITGAFDINKELSKFYELEQSADSREADNLSEATKKGYIKSILGLDELETENDDE